MLYLVGVDLLLVMGAGDMSDLLCMVGVLDLLVKLLEGEGA